MNCFVMRNACQCGLSRGLAEASLEPPNGHGKRGETGPRTYCSSLMLKRGRCSLDGRRALPTTPPRSHTGNSAGRQSFNKERESVHPVETLPVNDTPVGHMADPNPFGCRGRAPTANLTAFVPPNTHLGVPPGAPPKALRHSGAGGNYSRESPPMGPGLRCRGVGLCLRLGGPDRPTGTLALS